MARIAKCAKLCIAHPQNFQNMRRHTMQTRTPIRVFCVDDHAFLIDGLQSRLAIARDMEFVGRLSTAEDLIAECKRTRPDVVLLDIEMPGPDPFEALEDLRRQCPEVRTIML